jgi:hypothetical protein
MMDSVASHGASNDAVVKGLYDVVIQELKVASLLGPPKDAASPLPDRDILHGFPSVKNRRLGFLPRCLFF